MTSRVSASDFFYDTRGTQTNTDDDLTYFGEIKTLEDMAGYLFGRQFYTGTSTISYNALLEELEDLNPIYSNSDDRNFEIIYIPTRFLSTVTASESSSTAKDSYTDSTDVANQLSTVVAQTTQTSTTSQATPTKKAVPSAQPKATVTSNPSQATPANQTITAPAAVAEATTTEGSKNVKITFTKDTPEQFENLQTAFADDEDALALIKQLIDEGRDINTILAAISEEMFAPTIAPTPVAEEVVATAQTNTPEETPVENESLAKLSFTDVLELTPDDVDENDTAMVAQSEPAQPTATPATEQATAAIPVVPADTAQNETVASTPAVARRGFAQFFTTVKTQTTALLAQLKNDNPSQENAKVAKTTPTPTAAPAEATETAPTATTPAAATAPVAAVAQAQPVQTTPSGSDKGDLQAAIPSAPNGEGTSKSSTQSALGAFGNLDTSAITDALNSNEEDLEKALRGASSGKDTSSQEQGSSSNMELRTATTTSTAPAADINLTAAPLNTGSVGIINGSAVKVEKVKTEAERAADEADAKAAELEALHPTHKAVNDECKTDANYMEFKNEAGETMCMVSDSTL